VKAAKQLIPVQANGNLYLLSKLISFIVYWVFYFLFIQSNLSLRTALYYGQFVWSQKCQKSYIPYLYNISVKRTLGSVPLVSVLKRFDCMLTSKLRNCQPISLVVFLW